MQILMKPLDAQSLMKKIQDLLKASVGMNLGLHYLSGATTFDPVVSTIDPKLASIIVWLDSFINNVDRTSKNTNLLSWHKEIWLIDHGAGLYFHHSWNNWEEQATRPFLHIKDHVLLPRASELDDVDKEMHSLFTNEIFHSTVALIPEEWLLITGAINSIQ